MQPQSVLSMLATTKTLSLATLQNSQPDISLVPFLYHQEKFWIFISQLSPHTQQLLDFAACSVLIYDNHRAPDNHFATKRVSANCYACLEKEKKELVLDLMEEKLGKTMALLRQLGDFKLFSLTPKEGRFVAGFGQAYEIDFSDFSFHHISPSDR